jgi:archaellin
MRGLDWLYDTALQEQIAQISANAAQQISGIDTQKSSVAMSADQLKGQGEYQAAMANEAAKDAYYTALALGRKDFATGLQQTGKDFNDIKQNKVINNLLSQYGQWFKTNADGTVSNKNEVASKSTNTTKEKEIELTDAKGKKFKITQSQFDKLMNPTV